MALRCKQTFVYDGRTVVKAGTVVGDKSPMVKGREQLFEDVDEVVERATAAPGEKRATKPRTKAKKD